ncbi:MAG: RAD55 family ATPase [Thermoplasmatota archaeon]
MERRLRHRDEASEFVAFPTMSYPERRPDAQPPLWSKPSLDAVQAVRARFAVGIRAVDEFLGGGLPAGSAVAVVGPPFGGKRGLACQFLAAGIAASSPALVVLTDGDVAHWRQSVAHLSARVPDERKGLACFIDLFAAATAALPPPEHTLAAVRAACDALPSDRRRVVVDSFSTVAALSGFTMALSMLMRLVAELRREGATTMVLLEAGAHTPLELQLVKRQCEGAIEFRQFGGLPEVQLTGLGLASPSPWLPCRGESVQVATRMA